jgi:nicotinate-nucleotide pyrophosphorylase (carboxylating)
VTTRTWMGPHRSAPLPSTGAAAHDVDDLVRRALVEDLGAAGDRTTDLTVPRDLTGTAHVVARAPGTISGTDFITATYAALDPAVHVTPLVADGDAVPAGARVAEVEGPAASLVTGERVALNFLGHLSGVATATRLLADLIAHTPTRLCDTRKTTPGLRAAEKRAVVHGGGVNHRFGLYDAVLVKDNHIALGGGLDRVLERLGDGSGHLVHIEIEVDTIEQLERVLAHEARTHSLGRRPQVHAVLLDNMGPTDLARAVGLLRAHPTPILTEASGGVTPETVIAIAEAGPDVVSVGAITHSAPSLDVALDVDLEVASGSPRSLP